MAICKYILRSRIVAITWIVAISIVIGSFIAISVPKDYTATAQIGAGSNSATLTTTKELVNNAFFAKIVKRQVKLKNNSLTIDQINRLLASTSFVINGSNTTASIEITGHRRNETALVANQTAQVVVDNIGKNVPGARYYIVKPASVVTQSRVPTIPKILLLSVMIGILIASIFSYVSTRFWGSVDSTEYLDAFYQFEFSVYGKVSSLGKELQ